MAKIEITRTELVWPGKYNEAATRRAGGRDRRVSFTIHLPKLQG